jgi:predicted GIY-YIG superfamily endonuclease
LEVDLPSAIPTTGINDLQSQFPEVAAEAYGWDPKTVSSGSSKKLTWKCKLGHIWDASVYHRVNGTGCAVCANKQILVGFNDLHSKFPVIAKQAYGWDPKTVFASSNKKRTWRCGLGHIWDAAISKRTGGRGCPICSHRQLLVGFNDLKTKFPDIAAQAEGWDPTTVIAGTGLKMKWRCVSDHTWEAKISNRTFSNTGCPVCAGLKLQVGFNDLQTRFPGIADQACGWDPSRVLAGTAQKLDWRCENGHIWSATVDNRTTKDSGCPFCAEYGFNPEKDSWFYLMQRAGEQQLGITNDLHTRLKTHARNGWNLLESVGPAKGQKVLDTENAFKKWLKKEIGLMKGTTENWATTSMEVQSLAELKTKSGIETDLF